MAQKLKIIPIGGLGEIGKNMMVVEYGKAMILIDSGLMFPDEEMLGVDIVLPDFSYVVENAKRLTGIFLTHGHEDHTGALPYLLKEIKVPVYGSGLTLGLVRGKLREHRLESQVTLKEVKDGEVVRLGPFSIETIPVSHSIPDGMALAIKTPIGTIIHSGDFKFDQSPVDGRITNFSRFAALGAEGVMVLMSDSTNAEVPGMTQPEKTVGETLNNILSQAKSRVIAASFASHIHRIQQIIDKAHQYGRKVIVTGKSMASNIEIASQLGYLTLPEGMLRPMSDINRIPEDKLLIMSTGSQGEPMSALTRMASGDHKHVKIREGDTVIISATPVPGNERSVSRTIDQLFRCGADVHYESIAGVHVSGHASAEELKLLINLVRPQYMFPIHGETRHLIQHAKLAKEVGIPADHIILAENGDVVEISPKGKVNKNERVQSGSILVDGLGVGDVGDAILRDRMHLSQDGVVIVVLPIDMNQGSLISGPDIICRGFVTPDTAGDLIEDAKAKIINSFEHTSKEHITDYGYLRAHVRQILSRFFYDQIRRRPMILPIILEL